MLDDIKHLSDEHIVRQPAAKVVTAESRKVANNNPRRVAAGPSSKQSKFKMASYTQVTPEEEIT